MVLPTCLSIVCPPRSSSEIKLGGVLSAIVAPVGWTPVPLQGLCPAKVVTTGFDAVVASSAAKVAVRFDRAFQELIVALMSG